MTSTNMADLPTARKIAVNSMCKPCGYRVAREKMAQGQPLAAAQASESGRDALPHRRPQSHSRGGG